MSRKAPPPRVNRLETASLTGREFGLSGVQGNVLAPFLEGLEAAMPPGYSAGIRKRAAMNLAGCPPYFFGTLKRECPSQERFQTHEEARTAIFEYMEVIIVCGNTRL
jgi:hypothetical protein